MLVAELLENGSGRLAIASFGTRSYLDQFVGYAAHCGDDHQDATLLRSGSNNLDYFADAGCVGHRCPSKFHYSEGFCAVPLESAQYSVMLQEVLSRKCFAIQLNIGTQAARGASGVRLGKLSRSTGAIDVFGLALHSGTCSAY